MWKPYGNYGYGGLKNGKIVSSEIFKPTWKTHGISASLGAWAGWVSCFSASEGIISFFIFVICRPDEGQGPGSHTADLEVGVGGGL